MEGVAAFFYESIESGFWQLTELAAKSLTAQIQPFGGEWFEQFGAVAMVGNRPLQVTIQDLTSALLAKYLEVRAPMKLRANSINVAAGQWCLAVEIDSGCGAPIDYWEHRKTFLGEGFPLIRFSLWPAATDGSIASTAKILTAYI